MQRILKTIRAKKYKNRFMVVKYNVENTVDSFFPDTV